MPEKFRFERGVRRLADDELMHWKYIKRIKLANGKYRYWYDENSNTRRRNANRYDKSVEEYKRSLKELDKIDRENYKTQKEYTNAYDKVYKKVKNASDNEKHLRNVMDDYMNNHKVKFVVDAVIEKIAKKTVNYLNNNSKKKGTNFISKLFKRKDKSPNYTVRLHSYGPKGSNTQYYSSKDDKWRHG